MKKLIIALMVCSSVLFAEDWNIKKTYKDFKYTVNEHTVLTAYIIFENSLSKKDIHSYIKLVMGLEGEGYYINFDPKSSLDEVVAYLKKDEIPAEGIELYTDTQSIKLFPDRTVSLFVFWGPSITISLDDFLSFYEKLQEEYEKNLNDFIKYYAVP